MPLGWERINTKQSTPNKNIVFIKPLPGSTESIAKDYLERIAAQCLPIMNKHYLAVVSLEEYEPNLEFWGRNFNNGEVIQLVLRSPSTGHWLPFKFVQMVMMHELAHNKQMNHSKAFWAIRNEFATEMKGLWDKAYTGDGLWGRGVLLNNGAFAQDQLEEGEVLPEHMCGGTFKSRGGNKRKARPKITHKKRQEKRIKKKFGTNGMTLGADEEIKVKLEKGKKSVGKPRVAGSTRGRELRAAAAFARFEVKKEEPQIKDEELVIDSETESDTEDRFFVKPELDDAVDINGKKLVDSKGRGMVRVCEDEDKNDEDAKNELLELQSIPGHSQPSYLSSQKAAMAKMAFEITPSNSSRSKTKSASIPPKLSSSKNPSELLQEVAPASSSMLSGEASKKTSLAPRENSASKKDDDSRLVVEGSSIIEGSCPVCSVINNLGALTCIVCSNVLKPDFVQGCWRCKSLTCQDSKFINAGDVGLCGVCGARKHSNNST